MLLAAPAGAQTAKGIGGVAAVASVQPEGSLYGVEHLIGPLGGTALGITGVLGADLGRASLLCEVSFAGSISGPQTDDSTALGGPSSFTTTNRDVLTDVLVRLAPGQARSHRVRVQPLGGIGFAHDTTTHTQIVVRPFDPFQRPHSHPDESFTNVSLDLVVGLDVTASITPRFAIVPRFRLHWMPNREDFQSPIGIANKLFQIGVGAQFGF
jgi:hypothetical protein